MAAVPPKRWPVIAGWTAVAAALALGLCAVYLLPLLEVLRQTLQWVLRRGSTAISDFSELAMKHSSCAA